MKGVSTTRGPRDAVSDRLEPLDRAAADLLERERELTELDEVLALAQEERGRVVIVEGAAGLGKASLLTAAASEAGFACLRAGRRLTRLTAVTRPRSGRPRPRRAWAPS